MPIKIGFEKAAYLCDGKIISNSAETINAISIDSRKVKKGNLFIALSGQNHDGHDYASRAVSQGASAVLVNDKKLNELKTQNLNGAGIISVKDTKQALKIMAGRYRSALDCKKVIGITGSNGKTTTKDILKAIAVEKFVTVSNEGNKNNEIGMPLSILEAEDDCEVLILEMAMRQVGQIAELCSIADPQWGVITNIGFSHLEFLGSQKNIAKAKGELAQYLPSDGILFLNADDAWTERIAAMAKAQIITFGINNKAFFRATDIELDKESTKFRVVSDSGQSFSVSMPICGVQSVYSSLAAIAVSTMLGIDKDTIIKRLSAIEVSPLRMQATSINGVCFINDTYNASPSSAKLAISSLSQLGCSRKIAVLGDMMELGLDEKKFHYEVGVFAGKKGLDHLFTVGKLGEEIGRGAIETGMRESSVKHFNDKNCLIEQLKTLVKEGDVILFKASRVVELDKVVEQLSGHKADQCG